VITGVGSTLAVSAAVLLVFMVVTWVASLRLRDASIVDVAWGIAFVVVAFLCFALGDGDAQRLALVTGMTVVWGLRLALYIGRRKVRNPGEDHRYGAVRERYGDRFPLVSLYWVFLAQGALVLVVSLPIHGAAGSHEPLGALDYAGVLLWLAGLVFEAVGDAQLARFKADPANKGRVMDRGLWRYTRHPNYFGEFVVWWGFYLIALGAGAWWAFPSPLVMTALLTRVSGKDHLERAMKQRPGYAEYIARTSGFVPLPPRGSAT
jgi:steroid 5-alpha reductase family enzyme